MSDFLRDLYEVRADGLLRNGKRAYARECLQGLILREAGFDIGAYAEKNVARRFEREFGQAPDAVYWRVPRGD